MLMLQAALSRNFAIPDVNQQEWRKWELDGVFDRGRGWGAIYVDRVELSSHIDADGWVRVTANFVASFRKPAPGAAESWRRRD